MKKLFNMLIVYSLITAVVLGVVMLFKSCNSYIDNFDNDDKKKSFNLGNTFRCYENMFNNKRRLVKKSSGWSIHKDTFKKDDLLLPIYKCKKETKF